MRGRAQHHYNGTILLLKEILPEDNRKSTNNATNTTQLQNKHKVVNDIPPHPQHNDTTHFQLEQHHPVCPGHSLLA